MAALMAGSSASGGSGGSWPAAKDTNPSSVHVGTKSTPRTEEPLTSQARGAPLSSATIPRSSATPSRCSSGGTGSASTPSSASRRRCSSARSVRTGRLSRPPPTRRTQLPPGGWSVPQMLTNLAETSADHLRQVAECDPATGRDSRDDCVRQLPHLAGLLLLFVPGLPLPVQTIGLLAEGLGVRQVVQRLIPASVRYQVPLCLFTQPALTKPTDQNRRLVSYRTLLLLFLVQLGVPTGGPVP